MLCSALFPQERTCVLCIYIYLSLCVCICNCIYVDVYMYTHTYTHAFVCMGWVAQTQTRLLHREEYEKALDSNKSVDYTDLISMAGGFSRRCIRSWQLLLFLIGRPIQCNWLWIVNVFSVESYIICKWFVWLMALLPPIWQHFLRWGTSAAGGCRDHGKTTGCRGALTPCAGCTLAVLQSYCIVSTFKDVMMVMFIEEMPAPSSCWSLLQSWFHRWLLKHLPMRSFRDPCFSLSRLSQIDCCKRLCLAPLSMCLGGWIPGAAQIQPGDGWLRFSSTLCTNLHESACSRSSFLLKAAALQEKRKNGRMTQAKHWSGAIQCQPFITFRHLTPDDSLLDLKPYRFWGIIG